MKAKQHLKSCEICYRSGANTLDERKRNYIKKSLKILMEENLRKVIFPGNLCVYSYRGHRSSTSLLFVLCKIVSSAEKVLENEQNLVPKSTFTFD